MMKNTRTMYLSAGLACGALAATAMAQTPCPPLTPDNCLSNPGFEAVDQFSSFRDPIGWHTLSNNDATCRRRTADDLISPPAVIRTGNASMMIKTPGNSDFRGFTSDWRNFTSPGFPFYDPIFDYNGGDVVVSGWYYIPTTDPIVGDVAFIKLNVKRGNQDYATYDTNSEGLPSEIISGHTDNEWRYYEVRWPIAAIRDEVLFNEAEGYFTLPPFPDHLKITVGRFGFGSVASSGIIFWDDLNFRQEAPVGTCGCAADYNEDGGVDGADVEGFFTDWAASVGCSDVNQDGGTDGSDVEAFFLVWAAGGC